MKMMNQDRCAKEGKNAAAERQVFFEKRKKPARFDKRTGKRETKG